MGGNRWVGFSKFDQNGWFAIVSTDGEAETWIGAAHYPPVEDVDAAVMAYARSEFAFATEDEALSWANAHDPEQSTIHWRKA